MPPPARTRTKSMTTIFLALLVGMIFGAIFTALKLPLPAPPTLAGVMGIFLGGFTWQWITRTFLS
jgi:XapX domain-containing protein